MPCCSWSRSVGRAASLLVVAGCFLSPLTGYAQGGSIDAYAPAMMPESILSDEYAVAVVEEVLSEEPSAAGGFPTIQQVLRMRTLNGAHRGEVFTLKNGVLRGQDDQALSAGQRVVVQRIVRADGDVLHLNRDAYRLPPMLWLACAFIVLSILFGGLRSLFSVAGLIMSVGILFFVVVPGIAAGYDPLAMSILGAYMIACTSLFLAHGCNRRTVAAFISTCITLALAAFAAVVSVYAMRLFGMGSEEALFVATGQFAGVNMRGLLIGGFIIGSLGVLDDVTTAQSAAVDEISKANPSLSITELWKSGMSVGREHIASLINTLALAYVGASLPLFLLFRSNDKLPTWLVFNGEFIAEEIARTLVGSTALLLAVPISTWVAARMLRNRTGQVLSSGHAHHHHH